MSADFELWLAGCRDGSLSDDELAAFRRALGDPAQRRRLVEEWLLSAGLVECLRVQAAATASGRLKSSSTGTSQVLPVAAAPGYRWSRVMVLGGLAACLMCAVFLALSAGWVGGIGPRKPAVTRVERVSGDVEVSRGHMAFRLQRGLALKDGDVLSTGISAYLLMIYEDGSRVILGPESVLELHGEDRDPSLNQATGKGLKLARGVLQARIAPQEDGQLLVKTDEALVRVLGTEFLLRAAQQRTEVHLLHGQLAVAAHKGKKAIQLLAGWSTRVDAVGGIAQPEPLGERYASKSLDGRVLEIDSATGRLLLKVHAGRSVTLYMDLPIPGQEESAVLPVPAVGDEVSLTYAPGVWDEVRQLRIKGAAE